jgi:hypothetical protein
MKKTLLLLPALLFCLQANAQINENLIPIFTSDPGVRPSAIFTDGFESGNVSRLDFDGDNKPELVLTNEDSDGILQGILVLNAALLDTLWRVQDVQGLLTDDGTLVLFHGFADPDANGTREAIFTSDNEVILIDPRDPKEVNWRSSFNIGFPPTLRLIGIADMTDDGFEEIVVFLPEERQVIVFSDNPATSLQR